MSPGELLKAAERFVDAPDAAAVPVLTQAVEDLADMVGWAPGPIDPEGRFAGRLGPLLERLRERHAIQADASVATVHDALASLGDAIARHDRDLDADDPDADDESA
jgi:hypothetical protein